MNSIEIFNIPVSFNFEDASFDKVVETDRLLKENKPFVLFTVERKGNIEFRIFIPELFLSFDEYRDVTEYGDIGTFKKNLGVALMAYDYVKEIKTVDDIDNIKFIEA